MAAIASSEPRAAGAASGGPHRLRPLPDRRRGQGVLHRGRAYDGPPACRSANCPRPESTRLRGARSAALPRARPLRPIGSRRWSRRRSTSAKPGARSYRRRGAGRPGHRLGGNWPVAGGRGRGSARHSTKVQPTFTSSSPGPQTSLTSGSQRKVQPWLIGRSASIPMRLPGFALHPRTLLLRPSLRAADRGGRSVPEESRRPFARLALAASYAFEGRSQEAEAAKAAFAAKHGTPSAELWLNQGDAFARQQERDLLVGAFRKL